MQYPHDQSQHWPIGSGMVESANKLVVEARLKGAGRHWKREPVDPMLALHNIICSDRWDQEGPRIAQRLRQQAAQRKKSHRRPQLQDLQPTPTPPTPPCNFEGSQAASFTQTGSETALLKIIQTQETST